MARPTEAQIRTKIGAAIWTFENARKYGHENTENLIENTEAAYAAGVAASTRSFISSDAALASLRAQFAGIVSPAAVRAVLDPLWVEYAAVQGYETTDAISALVRLRQDFVDNSQSVNAREFTFDTSATESGTGDGACLRVTVDKDAEPLEGAHADTKTFECIADEHSGAREHAEVFEIRSTPAEPDSIKVAGSGLTGALTITTANATTGGLLTNPSFEQFAGTVSTLTSLTGWTVGSALSNFQLSTTTYRGYPGEPTTLYSLRIDANDSVEQNLNVRRSQFRRDVPYMLQIAYNRQTGSGNGTLTITLGSQTTNVALSAQTGWNILRMPLDENLFFENWNQEDPLVKVALTSRTTGYVLVDDFVLVPMTPVDGTYWTIVGGATPFLVGKTFAFTDTAAEGAIIQRWLARAYGAYLPSDATTSETWADPS